MKFFRNYIAPLILSTFLHCNSAHTEVMFLDECNELQNKANCIAKGNVRLIYIFDKITDNDFNIISFFATQLPVEKPFPTVYLNVLGGNMDAAIGIGRILRWRKASVQTSDIFKPNEMPMCYSACVLIAAGAVERNLDVIGLHSGFRRIYVGDGKYEDNHLHQDSADRVKDYYREMEISSKISVIEKETPYQELRYFYYDPDKPLQDQLIYQLGFRMRPAGTQEGYEIKRRLLNNITSNGSLDELARKGYADAQFKLGRNLFFGINSWKMNIERGFFWLNKASEQDNPEALHLLGTIYSNGLNGISINNAKAAIFYLKAAKLGNVSSQSNLSWAYFKGLGVKKNFYEALYWATKATDSGDVFAGGVIGALQFNQKLFSKNDIESYALIFAAKLNTFDEARRNDLTKILQQLEKRMSHEQILIARNRSEYFDSKYQLEKQGNTRN